MKIDLSKYFEAAESQKTNWAVPQLGDRLEVLASNINSALDWDVGDENWACMISYRSVVTYVCATIPIVFTASKICEAVRLWAQSNGIPQIVVVDDFDDKNYCISEELLARIFCQEMSENVDYNSLSINDLLWATAT